MRRQFEQSEDETPQSLFRRSASALVVPAALVVGDREERRHDGLPRDLRVLAPHVLRRRPRHEEQVNDPALREPVGVHRRPGVGDVDVHLRGVEPEGADGAGRRAALAARAVAQQEWDAPVEAKHRVVEVLVHVEVVQAERLAEEGALGALVRRRLEGERRGVLGDAVREVCAVELEVQGDGLRALGLLVAMYADGGRCRGGIE